MQYICSELKFRINGVEVVYLVFVLHVYPYTILNLFENFLFARGLCQRNLKAELCFLTESVCRRLLGICLVLGATSENFSVEAAVLVGISCYLVKTVIELGRVFEIKLK